MAASMPYPARAPIRRTSTARSSASWSRRASSTTAASCSSTSTPTPRRCRSISAARPSTSTSCWTNPPRVAWRSSKARRNTTSAPTGSCWSRTASTTTTCSWLDYLKNSGVEVKRPEKGHVLPSHGLGKDLGSGHGTTDNVNFRGRPVAAWIPIYGEEAKPELARIRQELEQRLGEARAKRVADTNRNLLIFPNLVLLDGSSVSVRSFQPLGPDRMRVRAWALGPVEETPLARQVRLDSFLTFYGPGGFATPDDIAALEAVQEGLGTYKEVQWSPLTRGIAKEGEQLNTDEAHLRAFWVQWAKLMGA